jgi:hypothetical protein
MLEQRLQRTANGRVYMKLLHHLLFLSLLFLGGCAQQPRVLAIAQPLQVYELPSAVQPVSCPDIKFVRSLGKLEVAGPTVKGTRGQGLNIATSVHRILLAMGIDTEVTLEQVDRRQAQVRIAFSQELSVIQRNQVRQVLQLIRN